MKRFIAALILLSLILSACGAAKTGQSPESVVTTEGEANEAATLYIDDIPEDADFGGAELLVLIRALYAPYDLLGESGGDIVLDAIYKRNAMIEERLNVTLVPVVKEEGDADIAELVRQSVLADSDPYHIYLARGPEGAALSLEAMLLSAKELPHINIDAPWWNKKFTKNMAINENELFYLAGDAVLSVFKCSNCVFFNKADFENRFGDYEEQIYQTVFDGKWTYDKFMSYVEQSYEDINGNGTTDAEDHYGAVYLDYAQDWYISSAGVNFMSRDDEGYPKLELYNDDAVTLCDYLQRLFSDKTLAWCFVGEQLDMGNFFKSRNALFLPGRFTYVDGNLRDMEDPYGIIPYPKVKESLEYMSASGHSGNFVTVPINNPIPEATSAVIEALTAEGYSSVFPIYYEESLKIKYTDGGTDAKMIDLIHDCINFYVTSNVFIGGERIGTMLQEVVMDSSKNYASFHKANIDKKEGLLLKLIETYEYNHSAKG
ncbi:MAG: hypothetical protein GX897_00125 [Clostridiales bacterium]|nr:hypothetical protein [Clostridiales bacterium]